MSGAMKNWPPCCGLWLPCGRSVRLPMRGEPSRHTPGSRNSAFTSPRQVQVSATTTGTSDRAAQLARARLRLDDHRVHRAHPRRVEAHGHQVHLAERAAAGLRLDDVRVHRARHRQRRQRRPAAGGARPGPARRASDATTNASAAPVARRQTISRGGRGAATGVSSSFSDISMPKALVVFALLAGLGCSHPPRRPGPRSRPRVCRHLGRHPGLGHRQPAAGSPRGSAGDAHARSDRRQDHRHAEAVPGRGRRATLVDATIVGDELHATAMVGTPRPASARRGPANWKDSVAVALTFRNDGINLRGRGDVTMGEVPWLAFRYELSKKRSRYWQRRASRRVGG